MSRSSLAIITLLDEAPGTPGAPGVPTHPIYYPPVISGGPGALPPWVMPPIYVVVPPGSIDGTHPEHPIYLPVYPAHPIVIPPGCIDPGPPLVPSHPIFLPPVISGGPGSLPPSVMPPIYIPPGAIDGVHPEHPIVLPPVPPLGIWGPTDPRPTHPIVLPPGGTGERPKLIEWHVGWSENTGWVIVGEPTFPVPTPSGAKGAAGRKIP
jgi:hypothetical protein